MTEENNTRTSRLPIIISAVLIYLAIAFLMLITVYSSDDYWYSTFLDDGWAKYLQKMVYHYNEFNGRMLVHFVAHVILHCGNWLFALLGTALCVAIPCSAAASAGLERRYLPACALLFGIGILAMSHTMLTRSVLWISAFCNYVLPTSMICALVALLQRITRDKQHRWWMWIVCIVYGFACGATTEQSGIVSVLAALYFIAVCLFTNRGKLIYPLLSGVSGAFGVLTIFMSPATEQRFASETDTGSTTSLLDSLWDGFEGQVQLLGSGYANALLILLLFAAIALVLWKTGRGKVPAVLCIIPALLAPAATYFSGDVRTWLYLAIFICLVLSALSLIAVGHRIEALLILLAVGSVCVMLPTTSLGERILLPFYLYCAAAAAVMLSHVIGDHLPKLSAAALTIIALATLILRIPLFSICWGNHEVEELNGLYAKEAKATGVLYYCMDYNMGYTHYKAFTDSYFYTKYLESVGLDDADGLQVYFYSADRPEVYVGEQRMTSPAFKGDNGDWLLPLRGIIEYLGGTVDWDAGVTTVTLYGRTYTIRDGNPGTCTVNWIGWDGTQKSLDCARTVNYFQTCLDYTFYSDVIGLNVTTSEDGSRITVTQ